MTSSGRSHRGMVAAGHRRTATAGADVLRRGGNAIDAALAAMAMSCVAEPVLSSPGGGGFAMVRSAATGQTTLVDFFPQTPRRRRADADRSVDHSGVWEVVADFGTATQAFHIGPATAATPGFAAGLAAVHGLGASMDAIDLYRTAIDAARDGVEITTFQHYLATVIAPILTATDGARALFAPDGDLVQPGRRWTNPSLADAFELLAKGEGTDGILAAAMVADQADGGHLTADDLAHYRAEIRSPLTVRLGRSTVRLNPLPSAGGTLIAHSLAAAGGATDPVAMAEAFRATARARADLEARARAENRAGTVDLSALVPATIRTRGTTHISVIDGDGNACAVTVSNGEGNGMVVDGFGFMLNNILGEEDVNPAGLGWPLDTRLSSMMSPTIVEGDDGSLAVLGSGGSNRIRTAVSQVLSRLAIDGDDPAAAVSAPRLHVEGDHLDFEDRFDPDTRSRLVAAFTDHRPWPEPNMFYGGVHTVAVDADGRPSAIGDLRRDGHAIIID